MSGGGGIQTAQGPGLFAPSVLLTLIKTVDGTGSGLDADLLDGQTGTYYLALGNATGTLAVANGGTGLASYAVGDLLYASAATTLAKLAGVATGNALISGGVTTAPSWGKIGLTTHVDGILPSANGGTGVNNAGTLTNASNTTITGGGTLALAGFTLTVPATGTAGLLGTAQTWSAANVFSTTVTIGNFVSGDGLTINHFLAQAPISTVASSLPTSGGRVGLCFSGGATANNLNRFAITAYATENWMSGGASGCELRFETAAIGASARTTALTTSAAAVTLGVPGVVSYTNALFTVGNGVGTATHAINGAAAANRLLRFQTNGVVRWDFAANATAEGGSDAGSDFTLSAYADNGAYIDDPFLVQRVAGGFFVLNRPVYSNPTSGTALTLSSTDTSASAVLAGGMRLATGKNLRMGTAAIATNATDGFIYVSTCAGTPTGTPTTLAGTAPIVIDTTNHKLYFYSGGSWRDAGP